MISDNKDHEEQQSAYVLAALERKRHAVGKKVWIAHKFFRCNLHLVGY